MGTVRVFVSYAGKDRAWAEWTSWQLLQAGYQVELDIWDWSAGDDFVGRMDSALTNADHMLALFSTSYFEPSRWTTEEWQTAFRKAKRRPGFLIPIRLDDSPAPELLAGLCARALHGLPEAGARRTLLVAVGAVAGRPDTEPGFPGSTPPAAAGTQATPSRLPGELPSVWGAVPSRNEDFTGRDSTLTRLREGLTGSARPVTHVIHGSGGVGKTQIAVEYVWRFANTYDAVWWINAEQTDLIGDQLSAFAVALGLSGPGSTVESAVESIRRHCRTHERWLIVLDNAPSSVELREWLLPGPGHVLVTSRDPDWRETATSVPLDVFARREAVAFLRSRRDALAEDDAGRIAHALGDLPLALAQAAGVLADGLSPAGYLDELSATSELLAEGAPPSYPVALTGSVRTAVKQVQAADRAAAQLMRLFAALAPEPVPLAWLITATHVPKVLPEQVAAISASPTKYRRALRLLARHGLIRLDANQGQVTVHRLTKAIVHGDDDARARTTADAAALIVIVSPDDTKDPMTWPEWTAITPHLRTLVRDLPGDEDLALAAGRTADYLLRRGDLGAGKALAAHLRQQWEDIAGSDHPLALHAAQLVGYACFLQGEYREARELDEDTVDRRRRVFGVDHPATLQAVNNLANDLHAMGLYEQARILHKDALARRRRVLGGNHPDTLQSINNLANDLHRLAEHGQARVLHKDALARRRQVLGDDHPDTLQSASNLAGVLHVLAEYESAQWLNEEVVGRRRRVLGEDHPDTLRSANNLANDLHMLGDREQAHLLHKDTLARRRAVLGEDHPDTRQSVINVAVVANQML